MRYIPNYFGTQVSWLVFHDLTISEPDKYALLAIPEDIRNLFPILLLALLPCLILVAAWRRMFRYRARFIAHSLFVQAGERQVFQFFPGREVTIGGKGCDIELTWVNAVFAKIIWNGRSIQKLIIFPQAATTRIGRGRKFTGTGGYRFGQTLLFRYDHQTYELVLHLGFKDGFSNPDGQKVGKRDPDVGRRVVS